MQHQAEALKVKFGAALSEEVYDNRIITIPGIKGRDYKEISEKNLARIIQARMEEIFDYVVWEIRRSGYERKLIGGIVLTGGGSLLRDIEKLCEFHTGMSARIGVPIEHLGHGYTEQVASPIFSTAIGLLLNGIAFEEENVRSRPIVKEKPVVIEQPVAETVKFDNPVVEEKAPQAQGGKWLESIFKKTKEWFEAEPDVDLK